MDLAPVYYKKLQEAVRKYAPSMDMELLERAYYFAADKHHGIFRKDKVSLYVMHPLATATIVAEMGLDDTDTILAALLHDTIEDTETSNDELTKQFGPKVAELVEGVTKLTRVNFSTQADEQMENLRKMFMAMSRDIRVILIKIADRLHNMRTMQFQTPAKQRSKSFETMEIYAPLAHRLGMQRLKWELEDISLRYLDPVGYQEITNQLSAKQASSESFMASVQETLTERMEQMGIHCTIYGRIKHIYSIYRKMYNQNKQLDEVYDLYAFRIIVDDIADCYTALGQVHDLYNLIPGRFKDYISTPKPNMYQSLHTTVIGRDGIPFEVQIRTWQMHQVAEYGVAAHWKYKDGVKTGEQDYEWVRRLLENQQESDAEDFISSLKVDMFDDEVFVFTPKGKVISLPAGSTPIDFAYAIHSGVGNRMVGAKVNSRMVGFDTRLQNGDIIEILTSNSAKGPSRDWLNLCQSNSSRIKIKQWFKRERREENIVHGKASFESELRHAGFNPTVLNDPELQKTLLQKLSQGSMDDIYAAIGYGGMTALKAVNRIRDDLQRMTKNTQQSEKLLTEIHGTARKNESGVIVEGMDRCMVKFARCCTPVPGDAIAGFITKGFGVSVHRQDCPNAAGARDNRDGRWVRVHWAGGQAENFSTSLELEVDDRDNIVLDVATILAGQKLRVSELSGRSIGDGRGIVSLTFEIRDTNDLEAITRRLSSIKGVKRIRRGRS